MTWCRVAVPGDGGGHLGVWGGFGGRDSVRAVSGGLSGVDGVESSERLAQLVPRDLIVVEVEPVEDGLVEEPLLLVVAAPIEVLGVFEQGQAQLDQTGVVGEVFGVFAEPLGQAAAAVDGTLLVVVWAARVNWAGFHVWARNLARWQRVPFPDPNSWSARTYRRTIYGVYVIRFFRYGVWSTWKYGETRVGVSRPWIQIGTCQLMMAAVCAFDWIAIGRGWYRARVFEAFFIAAYKWNYGHCPWGQYRTCR
jgi:hypothetical protein